MLVDGALVDTTFVVVLDQPLVVDVVVASFAVAELAFDVREDVPLKIYSWSMNCSFSQPNCP